MKPAYQDNLSTLYITEATEGAKHLEPQSVHTIVTSPPYFGLRSYLDKDHPDKDRELGTESSPDEFVEKLVAVFEALRPALRDDGTLWVNLGQSYCGYKGDNYGRTAGNLKSHAPTVQDVGKRWDVGTPQTTGYKPKDLIPTAWLFGIAMQRAGWYLRSDIIWSKGNPMPSSVTDRPSTSHEYVLMFSKKPRYFFDMDAVKEKRDGNAHGGKAITNPKYDWKETVGGPACSLGGPKWTPGGNETSRNLRTVWNINTTPYSGSHFAVFPIAIPDRIIRAATSERGVCGACGAPWRRVVEHKNAESGRKPGASEYSRRDPRFARGGAFTGAESQTVGWEPGCSCGIFEDSRVRTLDGDVYPPGTPVPCSTVLATVLDPFVGSGTTLLAARKLGRHSVGFDLDARSVEHVGNRLGYQEVLL